MKVKCIKNQLNQISNTDVKEWLKNDYSNDEDEIECEINKEYIVHGIVYDNNAPFYYIYLNEFAEYPIPIFYDFFEILDSKVSKYWQSSSHYSTYNKIFFTNLVFKEWAEDYSLYEKLLDEEEKSIILFSKYKNLIEKEF